MKKLLCATTNKHKFEMGKTLCKKYGIDLEQVVLDIDEIQGENPEKIVRDKAQKAYESIKKPVVVTDDSWNFVGLNGFPGAYMKSMNHWLTPEHFIDLMRHVKDRTVILEQYLAYIDEYETVIFQRDIAGKVLESPRGLYGPPIMHVVTHDTDGGRSISEQYDLGLGSDLSRFKNRADAWEDLAIWYNQKTLV